MTSRPVCPRDGSPLEWHPPIVWLGVEISVGVYECGVCCAHMAPENARWVDVTQDEMVDVARGMLTAGMSQAELMQVALRLKKEYNMATLHRALRLVDEAMK